MGRVMTHPEVAELLGAFALDAVDADEAQAIQEHLATCATCSEELADHRRTAALLASQGGDAPDHLWDVIAGRLDPPAPEREFPRLMPPLPDRTLGQRTAPVVSLRDRRPAITRRIAVAALGAAAVLLVVGLLGLQVRRADDRASRADAAAASLGVSRAAQNALHDPTAHRLVLDDAIDHRPAADVVVLPSGAGYLVNRDMAKLPAGHTYQLWAQIDGRMISEGVIGSAPTTSAFTVASTQHPTVFAVTIEPDHGSQLPTLPAVAATA